MDAPFTPLRRRWFIAPVIILLGLLVGGAIGMLTSAFNAWLSPYYFEQIMWWNEAVFDRAIGQGMLEGGVFGLIFGIITAISFAASTRFRGSMELACRTLLIAAAVAVACWMIGGAAALLWARIDPASYASIFPAFIVKDPRRFGFAWVGGSIWGAYAGTFIGALSACIFQHRSWRKLQKQTAAGFQVLQTALAPPPITN